MEKQGINFEVTLTPKEVCDMFQVSRSTLYRWEKYNPDFPEPLRINTKVLRYRKIDIEEFKKKVGFCVE